MEIKIDLSRVEETPETQLKFLVKELLKVVKKKEKPMLSEKDKYDKWVEKWEVIYNELGD